MSPLELFLGVVASAAGVVLLWVFGVWMLIEVVLWLVTHTHGTKVPRQCRGGKGGTP